MNHARPRELPGVLVGSLEPVTDPARMVEIEAADVEIGQRIAEVVEAKRRQPADDSPVQMSRRIMLAPYEIGGKQIPTGTFVMAGLASANRDETFWGEDGGQLRVDRPGAKSHLSFGGGPHHCLGAALARLEGRVAITRLIRRLPELSLDGEVSWNGRLNLRGPAAPPVRVG